VYRNQLARRHPLLPAHELAGAAPAYGPQRL
jgi:hypothetical protein